MERGDRGRAGGRSGAGPKTPVGQPRSRGRVRQVGPPSPLLICGGRVGVDLDAGLLQGGPGARRLVGHHDHPGPYGEHVAALVVELVRVGRRRCGSRGRPAARAAAPVRAARRPPRGPARPATPRDIRCITCAAPRWCGRSARSTVTPSRPRISVELRVRCGVGAVAAADGQRRLVQPEHVAAVGRRRRRSAGRRRGTPGLLDLGGEERRLGAAGRLRHRAARSRRRR